MRTVTIVGIDGVNGANLPEAAITAITAATLVVSGRHALSLVAGLIPAAASVVELGSLREGLAALDDHPGPAVVLASGDPGWFGIVRTLSTRFAEPPRVIPARSCLSLLAAACGQPWDQVVTHSAHGRDPRAAINAARALPAVAILTGPRTTVSDLARALEGWPRTLTIGERLGYPDQRVTSCPAAEAVGRSWAEPNCVLVTDPSRPPGDGGAAGPPSPGRGWARPESEYDHRAGMITKAEVRALAVAWLAPAPGRLIWDIGAGSGSVGIECARHGAAVICVESDPRAIDQITTNATRHAAAVRTVLGHAPEALADLPEPDSIFVGGGGPAVVAAIADRGIPTVVVACAAVDHALAARNTLRAAGYAVEGTQLAASRLASLPDGAVRLAALNPTILLIATTVGGPS